MSADGVLSGVTASLTTGLTAVGDEIGEVLAKDPLFNTYVPGVVEQRTEGTPPNVETRELSPTFGEAMSISTDVAKTDASSFFFDPTGKSLADRFAYLSAPPAGPLDQAYNFFGDAAGDEAALRAMEIRAEVILKGTKVDGVYSADPFVDPTATKFSTISYLQVLERQLRVMDATAISLCMDNKLPIVVFNLRQPGSIRQVVMGEPVGTTVTV